MLDVLEMVFSAIGAIAAISATVIAAKTLSDTRKDQANAVD